MSDFAIFLLVMFPFAVGGSWFWWKKLMPRIKANHSAAMAEAERLHRARVAELLAMIEAIHDGKH